MAWTFTFDHAQNRFSRLRIGVALAGDSLFDPATNTDCYLHPVVRGVMLAPAATLPGWDTSNSGIYAKLSKSDFGSPSTITEVDQSGAGVKKFLVGAKNLSLQTSTTWAVNTGFLVEILNYSNGANGIALECGWGSSTSLTSGTTVRVYADGFTEVRREGVIIKTGKITGSQSTANPQNSNVKIFIMPHRVRELLIWSQSGDGFTAIMPDIEEGATSPVITPNAKFWLRQPDLSTNILVAPLKFVSSGNVSSFEYSLAEAPDSADTRETYDNKSFAGGTNKSYRVYGDQSHRTGNTDTAAVSLVNPSGSSFTVNGSNKVLRLKSTLSGDGNSTPMIYGAEAGWKGLDADTDDAEAFDATDYVRGFSLSVPDQGGPSAEVIIGNDEDVQSGVAQLKVTCNRPFEIAFDGVTVLNGRSSPPKWTRLYNEVAESIPFTIVSTIEALKNHKLREIKPFDGMNLCRSSDEDSVFRWLCRQAGIPDSAMDFEDSSIVLGDVAPARCGEWGEFADVGSSLWDVLTRFLEDYLGGWFIDAVPTTTGVKLKICSQATLEAASVSKTLYWTSAAAAAAGVDPEDLNATLARRISVTVVPPESNEVIVTGYDPRTQKPISAVKRDYDSQDPTLAPSARPANWIGEVALVGVINAGITRQEIANEAADVIAAKLFEPRMILEVECELMLKSSGLPVWRGDKVQVDGVDYLVQSISATCESDATGFKWFPATYVLSNISGRTGGLTASEIAARESRIRQERLIQRRNAKGLSLQTRSGITVIS